MCVCVCVCVCVEINPTVSIYEKTMYLRDVFIHIYIYNILRYGVSFF